jgi:hypothetical protein
MIAVPNSTDVRQMLPWNPSSIVATAYRRSDDRPARRQWRDAFGVSALLTVGAVDKKRRLGIEHHGSLVELVAMHLGHPNARGVVLCGPRRANQKPVVQLHDRRGRTIAFVKVAWNDLTRRLLDDELAALNHLAAVPDKGFSTPPVLADGTFGATTWLALGPIGVERRSRPDPRQVDELAKMIEQTGSSWEGRTADSDYVIGLARAASGLDTGAAVVEQLTERWSEHTMTLGASHGDFVPWNMLSGSPEPAVWDWERYQTAAPVGFDRLHLRIQVGLHRSHASMTDTLRRLERDLGTVLPDLASERRQAHFDWYIADLLCRYERDASADPSRLPRYVTDLHNVLKERKSIT